MIDPGTRGDGEEFEAYNKRRWGGSGWTNHLRSEGRKDGAMFGNWKWWPNTLKAHQLVLYAEKENNIDTSTSNAALFQASYEEGENISSTSTLVQVGEKLGLEDTDALTEYLENGKGASEVMKEIQAGRKKYQIKGVPFFIVDGDAAKRPYGMSGAQSADTLVELFEEVGGEVSE